jgi:hypothetical protein
MRTSGWSVRLKSANQQFPGVKTYKLYMKQTIYVLDFEITTSHAKKNVKSPMKILLKSKY